METALTATVVRYGANTLKDFLVDQWKAATGFKAKLKVLKSLLELLNTVTEYAGSRPSLDPPTSLWLQKLSDLAYEIQDVVDTFDTEAMRARSVRDFFSQNNQFVSRFKIGKSIEAVMTKLNSLSNEKNICLDSAQLGMAADTPSRQVNFREIYSQNSLGVVVGREGVKNNIIRMLKNSETTEDAVPVITIVGVGGLGKTTVTQLVFNDGEVKDHFDLTMWQVVGCDFDPEKLTKSILELATEEGNNISHPQVVLGRLQQALSGKRFLLVLDDVWNENPTEWGKLKRALEHGAKGSKIIVTTRSTAVASIVGSLNPVHLEPLSDDGCLSLFLRSAFGAGEGYQRWEETAKEIVTKCRGVPLAAVALGSLLRTNRDEDYWSSISRSEIFEIPEAEQMILGALKLSYDHLSSQSKQCFAFCSLFPKNYVIERENLIGLWLANGFICSQRKFSAESMGNIVFSEFIRRSFFQEVEKDDDGHVTECKMHDLIHDLAQSVAGDRCRIVRYDNVQDIKEETGHLFIDEMPSSISQVCAALCKPRSLRTVILPCQGRIANVHLLDYVFKRLKLLRVLSLNSYKIMEVPTSIGKLIHLRYLDLSECAIEVLPHSITFLQNLEYLILRRSDLRELPKNLRNMQRLRSLDISGCRFLTHMPLGFSLLTNLQRLSDFVVGGGTGTGCSIAELKDLDLYGELNIQFYEKVNNDSWTKQKILKNKKGLKSLRIDWWDTSSVHNVESLLDDLCPNEKLKRLQISGYEGFKFPTWLAESRILNLVEVELNKCDSCEHIPQFGNLQFLTQLQIKGMAGVKRIDAEFYGNNGQVKGFPSLEELYLDDLPNLEEWSGCEGVEAFPCLDSLTIKNCPKLMAMPRFPRIQHLKISFCNGSLLSSQNVGSFTSLSSLEVAKIPGMASLPSGSFRDLASLRRLYITDCTELQFLPIEEVQHLTALEHLAISDCENLESLPASLDHLGALQTLLLRNCVNLRSLPSGLHSLTSLRSLKILNCLSVSLPAEVIEILNSVHEFAVQVCCKKVNLSRRLQQLETLLELTVSGTHQFINPLAVEVMMLRRMGSKMLSVCCCDGLGSLIEGSPSESRLEDLTIKNCSSLTALPEWVAEMRSLRSLSIDDCPELASLPMGFKDLHSLEWFDASSSPQLKSRYGKDGEDWQIISHVPRVYLDPLPLF